MITAIAAREVILNLSIQKPFTMAHVYKACSLPNEIVSEKEKARVYSIVFRMIKRGEIEVLESGRNKTHAVYSSNLKQERTVKKIKMKKKKKESVYGDLSKPRSVSKEIFRLSELESMKMTPIQFGELILEAIEKRNLENLRLKEQVTDLVDSNSKDKKDYRNHITSLKTQNGVLKEQIDKLREQIKILNGKSFSLAEVVRFKTKKKSGKS